MKKFLSGLVSGLIIASSIAVFASDDVKISLVQIKYFFNGESKTLEKGYETLNYNGRVYVPIRFVSSSMGATVNYNEKSKTITVDYETKYGFTAVHPYLDEFRAGNIKVVPQGNGTKVTGQVKLFDDGNYGKDTGLCFFINLYDSQGNFLAKTEDIIMDTDSGSVKTFEGIIKNKKISSYAVATMNGQYEGVSAQGVAGGPGGELNITDKNLSIGDLKTCGQGNYTVVNGHISYKAEKDGYYDVDATLTFYDELNHELGKCKIQPTKWYSNGMGCFETVGKGQFSNYKKVKLTVNSVKSVKS